MLKPRDLAPEFILPDENGNEVALTQLLQSGPIILYFYPADCNNCVRTRELFGRPSIERQCIGVEYTRAIR